MTLHGKRGTNFAFYTSKDATRVELCLFDKAQGANEIPGGHLDFQAKEEVLGNDGKTLIGYIWHGFSPDIHEGALYGFRVHSDKAYDPVNGIYFNPNKLLVDPCAKAVTHEIHDWNPRHFPSNMENDGDIMPKARVVDWLALQRKASEAVPHGALYTHPDTNLLELHVKGATWLHPKIPKEERGTYKALSDSSFVNWVKRMGFKGIELMPVESFGTDSPLAERGKHNHWGYMTMVPTAPYTGYAATNKPEEELANTITTLKQNGIEVVLDVVPNHTLESGPGGPALNLRLEDNGLYLHHDYTGCGNTRDFGHPINRRMFLEELKYWKGLGISGFRIDLATVIGREYGGGFDPNSRMLREIRSDPELKDIKFYGEPWDLGEGANMRQQVGKLASRPVAPEEDIYDTHHLAEWNPFYRESMQDAALSHDDVLSPSQMIWCMAGTDKPYSSPMDTVNKPGGGHDGATLKDAVSGKFGKNNWPNGEENRDGNPIQSKHYWENPEDQLRVQRFAMGLLAVSQGTPMITIGHERCHTQNHNTNLYCLSKNPEDPSNHSAWIKWQDRMDADARSMMGFTSLCNRFRNAHPALRRATYFTGAADEASGLTFNNETMKDVTWLNAQGKPFAPGEIDQQNGFGMLLSGDPGNSSPNEKCFTRRVQRQERDCPLLVLVNQTMGDVTYNLPNVPGVIWKPVLKSNPKDQFSEPMNGEQQITLSFHSMIAFEGERVLEKTTHVGRSASSNSSYKRAV